MPGDKSHFYDFCAPEGRGGGVRGFKKAMTRETNDHLFLFFLIKRFPGAPLTGLIKMLGGHTMRTMAPTVGQKRVKSAKEPWVHHLR